MSGGCHHHSFNVSVPLKVGRTENGCIGSKVTGPLQNKRNNGVEVPCCYRIKGPKRCIDKC